jgi:hypothetical protein
MSQAMMRIIQQVRVSVRNGLVARDMAGLPYRVQLQLQHRGAQLQLLLGQVQGRSTSQLLPPQQQQQDQGQMLGQQARQGLAAKWTQQLWQLQA